MLEFWGENRFKFLFKKKPSVNLSACKLKYNELQCFGRFYLVILHTGITMSKTVFVSMKSA